MHTGMKVFQAFRHVHYILLYKHVIAFPQYVPDADESEQLKRGKKHAIKREKHPKTDRYDFRF